MQWCVISAVVVFLFLAGLSFLGAIINGPNFHPKVDLGGPNYRLLPIVSCCLMLRLMLTDPALLCRRRPAASHNNYSTVCNGLQDTLYCTDL